MQNTARKFLLKVAELPEEVGFFYQSKTLNNAINELCKDYNFHSDYLGKLIDDITIDNFNFAGLQNKMKQDLNLDDDQVRQATVDYLGKIFLPIDEYIKDVSIENEIKTQGGNVNNFQAYIDSFKNEIDDKKYELLDELTEIYKENIDLKEEYEAVMNIFNGSLVYILKRGIKEALADLNNGLSILLNNKKGFQKDLEKILYNNAELLTHAHFDIDGKVMSPTIGNWIQDFIKNYGTDYANNLLITKYITESKNAKLLNPEEKKIVQKLLQLYRNLKFFPDAFSDLPPERWEIIPVEKSGTDDDKIEKKLSFPKTKAEKEIDVLAQEEENYKEGGLERLAIQEEIDKKKRIEDLQIEINKYKENSLERRALEEELKKIKA